MVVRVTLLSGGDNTVRFKAIEYLKGTGPSEITVAASRYGKDGHEAVLFLTHASSAKSQSGSGDFVFTDTDTLHQGVSIDTMDPAWLPVDTTGASGSAVDPVYITDSGVATGGSQETISLTDLKAKITWMEGGEGVPGYDDCVNAVVRWLQYYRDYEEHHGGPRTVHEWDAALTSGTGTGTVVTEYGPRHDPGYSRIWLTGQDAGLFTAGIVDGNTNASDGYTERIATARPLPGGVYRFRDHSILYEYIPCGFTPAEGAGQLDWKVTATAPTGTLHELFFDPVTVGSAIAADATSGTLKPRAFTGVGSVSATLGRIAYESSTVKLKVTPVTALAGHVVDVIELDGGVSLSLSVASATVDAVNDTLSWSVSSAPWESGDKLMVRIREAAVPASTPQESSR